MLGSSATGRHVLVAMALGGEDTAGDGNLALSFRRVQRASNRQDANGELWPGARVGRSSAFRHSAVGVLHTYCKHYVLFFALSAGFGLGWFM